MNPQRQRFSWDRPKPKRDFRDPLLTELEGCIALGMEKDALGLANRILRNPAINGAQFAAAVETLLTMDSRLKPRRKVVARAYNRLSAKAKRSVRYWVLSFYHSAGDYAAAEHFVPKRFTGPTGLFELAWAWDIWSALNDEKSLTKHFPTLVTAASDAEHPYIRGLLLTCLGDYCVRTAQWRLAVEFYRHIPIESANTQQAILGPLFARSGELLAACSTAREALGRFKSYHDPELEVVLPGNLRSQHLEIERKLNVMESGLKRLIGKRGLKQMDRHHLE